MLLDVRPILYTPGGELPFRLTLDLSDMAFSGRYPVQQGVEVSGRVRNSADVLHLDLTASTTLDACCDRCGREFPLRKEVSYTCLLAQEVQNEDQDEIVSLQDGQVDVADLARTAFILEMDTKTLCSKDCKGLCPRCGANLNLGPCSCTREMDPRWSVLATLFENKESVQDGPEDSGEDGAS